jgi:undecaprenyl pyrophosphate phosphatase UppP
MARLRGFRAADAARLSRDTALPVILGATLLRAVRVRRQRLDRVAATAIAGGAAASFVSTLASARLVARSRANRSLMPYAAYRVALATVIARRLACKDIKGPCRTRCDNVPVTHNTKDT